MTTPSGRLDDLAGDDGDDGLHRLSMTILMTPDMSNFAGNVPGGLLLNYLHQPLYQRRLLALGDDRNRYAHALTRTNSLPPLPGVIEVLPVAELEPGKPTGSVTEQDVKSFLVTAEAGKPANEAVTGQVYVMIIEGEKQILFDNVQELLTLRPT